MKCDRMKKTALSLLIIALCGVMLIAGCVSPSPPPQTPTPSPTTTATPSPSPTPVTYTVTVASNPQYGNILVDGNGMTLYYATRDVPGNGTSFCYDTCAVNWPPFTAVTLSAAPPLNAADFGSITRTGGVKQVTYKGYPLYYFHTDAVPGDTKGYGLQGIWFVINPAGIVTVTATPTPTAVMTTEPTTKPTTNPASYSSSDSSGY